jgi:hypothetical protein
LGDDSYNKGMAVRRSVLGEAHIARTEQATDFKHDIFLFPYVIELWRRGSRRTPRRGMTSWDEAHARFIQAAVAVWKGVGQFADLCVIARGSLPARKPAGSAVSAAGRSACPAMATFEDA